MPKEYANLYNRLKGASGKSGGDPTPADRPAGGGLGRAASPVVPKSHGKKRDYDEVLSRLDKAERGHAKVHTRLARAAMKRLSRDAFDDDEGEVTGA